jgi:hypothetical protein
MVTGRRLIGRTGITMPDEHGGLTEADNDLIERWWGQHSKHSVICPVCKTTNWKIVGHIVKIQRNAADANGSTYPHIIITCNSCAHSMFFDAVRIGITMPSAGQRTTDAAVADQDGNGDILGLTQRLADSIHKLD